LRASRKTTNANPARPVPGRCALALRPAPQEEHAATLAERDPVQHQSDLGEREAEFLQRHDPVDLSQLCCRVAAVPRVWVDGHRPQQPDLVVMPERADRHTTEPGELADAEHGTSMHPSRYERVKAIRAQTQPGSRS
jgi:hypothetical protein